MMRKLDFWGRIVSLIAVIAALSLYQIHAFDWKAEEEANQREIAEVSALNEGTAKKTVHYTDGVYTGSGEGFSGTITVSVTVADGSLKQIDLIESDGEDAAYLDKAQQIIENMIQADSPDVDTISGATFSSTGIKEAVKAAMEGAN